MYKWNFLDFSPSRGSFFKVLFFCCQTKTACACKFKIIKCTKALCIINKLYLQRCMACSQLLLAGPCFLHLCSLFSADTMLSASSQPVLSWHHAFCIFTACSQLAHHAFCIFTACFQLVPCFVHLRSLFSELC